MRVRRRTAFALAAMITVTLASPAHATTTDTTIGGNPNRIAVSPDGQRVYVSDRADGTVRAVDTSTGSVIGVAQVLPTGAVNALTVSADSQSVYAAAGAQVYQIDTNSLTVTETIALPVQPSPGTPGAVEALALSPDNTRLYVSQDGAGTSAGNVVVIDTATGAALSSIALPSPQPWDISVTPDATTLFVTGFKPVQIDLTTGTVRVISYIRGHTAQTITPTTNGIYSLGLNSWNLNWNIDLVDRATAAANWFGSPMGRPDIFLRLSARHDATKLYVSQDPAMPGSVATVSVLDAATGANIGTVAGSTLPDLADQAVSPDDSTLYLLGRQGVLQSLSI